MNSGRGLFQRPATYASATVMLLVARRSTWNTRPMIYWNATRCAASRKRKMAPLDEHLLICEECRNRLALMDSDIAAIREALRLRREAREGQLAFLALVTSRDGL